MRHILCLGFLLLLSRGAQGYDLGGPCVVEHREEPAESGRRFRETGKAVEAQDWAKAIALEKQSVRERCDIEYNWYMLVSYLVSARKDAEAIDVLDEMDRRGFVVKPFDPGSGLENINRLLDSAAFKASRVGKKLEEKKRLSEIRRAEFRKKLAAMTPAERPPANYVAQGACPFECCTYREWTVEADTPLVDRPGGSKRIGTAKQGTRVKGLTGEVRLKPVAAGIIFDKDRLKKGDIIFQLDYEGEGYSHFWYQGEVVSDELSVANFCPEPNASCWAEYIDPPGESERPVWWVNIELPDGTRGWTDKARNFGNMDACG
jgi:pentatricopeptide repeat protein